MSSDRRLRKIKPDVGAGFAAGSGCGAEGGTGSAIRPVADKKYAAPAAGRLLDLVELLAAENHGFSLNEIARRLDLPLNTVYRIAQEMEQRQYLVRLNEHGGYQLGSRFYQIGQVVGDRIDLRQKALPVLQSLSSSSGETVHLCIWQDNWQVLLDLVETIQPIRIHVAAGSLMQPHASAFGKCLLAYDQERLAEFLAQSSLPALTERTINEPGALRRELSLVRQQGWALDQEEYMIGVRCIGAPVFGPDGQVAAALGIMGPAFRLTQARVDQLVPDVCRAAASLSAALGFPAAVASPE